MKQIFTFIIFILISFNSYSQWNVQGDHEPYCAHINRFDHQTRALDDLYYWQSEYLYDYDVKFYFLDIKVSNTSTYIEGNTTINAIALTVIDTFAFELIPLMTISQVIINDADYTDVFYRDGASNNVLVPIEEIAEGEMISAQIFYSGTPDGGSFFVGVDNDYSPAWQKYVTWTLSEPFAASDWFAVKQDLEDKADSCWVFLTTNSANMAGSQGILTDVVDLGDGNTRYEWKSNYPIDYYLISFAVSEYQDYSIYAFPEQMNGDSVLIQNFIYDAPGCLDYYQEDIDETPAMVELLSDLYTLYPFHEEKYGHCLTRLGGGMEHQTMTTIGGFSFGLVAHELGHMWFGDNVTCATWSDIWINEGFATYSDYLCRYYLQSPSSGTSFMIERQNSAMSSNDGSVYIPEGEVYPGNEWRIFDGRLSYNKGAAIIHTLRHEIQDDTLFFNVMEAFQNQFANSTATGDDFKEVAESITGMDFDPFFNQWYYGQGYPIYDFEWYSTDNGYFHLTSTQSTSSTTPLFQMLMDFKLIFTDATDTIISLNQTDNLNEFEVFTGKTVAAVQVDPNQWTMEHTSSLVVGMKETDKKVYFTIGPNPAKDYLNIYFLNPSNETKEITIADISGKIILQTNTNDQQLRLDTSSLINGVYMVSVTDGNDAVVKRFIK
jgi:aminopeptidase N